MSTISPSEVLENVATDTVPWLNILFRRRVIHAFDTGHLNAGLGSRGWRPSSVPHRPQIGPHLQGVIRDPAGITGGSSSGPWQRGHWPASTNSVTLCAMSTVYPETSKW